MNNKITALEQSHYKDRSIGLTVFGILEITLGGIFALLSILMTLLNFMLYKQGFIQQETSDSSVTIPGLFFYALMAVVCIWLGIGSIKAKRWARTLWLVISWLILICGIMGIAWMAFMMLDMNGLATPDVPAEMQIVIVVLSLLFMAIFYIVIPSILIIFYGSKHTKATCENRNPALCWTDKCPAPVLALSLMCWYGAAAVPLAAFTNWATPFFGQIINGMQGAILIIITLAILIYIASAAYRLKMAAWWVSLMMLIVWGISNVLTFSKVNLMEFYEKMGYSDKQLEAMQQLNLPNEPFMLIISIFWIVITITFLMLIRKYFTSAIQQK